MIKTASVDWIKSRFNEVLKDSAAGPVVVTRNNKPVAVIVSVQDEDEVERLLMGYSPKLQAILAKSRQQIQAGEVLSHDEFWAEVKLLRATDRRRTKRKTAAKRNGK